MHVLGFRAKRAASCLETPRSGDCCVSEQYTLIFLRLRNLYTLADGQAEAVGTEHDRSLSVPHKRWQERSFVKAPLADLACGGFQGLGFQACHSAAIVATLLTG